MEDEAILDLIMHGSLDEREVARRLAKERNLGGFEATFVMVDDPVIEARVAEAHGAKAVTFWQKLKNLGETAWKDVTRTREHLPNVTKFDTAREVLRLLDANPARAGDVAMRHVAGILEPLKQEHLLLFERMLLVENMVAALRLGQLSQVNRLGFDPVSLRLYYYKIKDLVAASPEVMQALSRRRAANRLKVQELVDHGILKKDLITDVNGNIDLSRVDSYFHQQVLEKQHLDAWASGGARPQKITRGFQKARTTNKDLSDKEFDYNTSFIESEMHWLTQAEIELGKEKLLRKLGGVYDTIKEIKAEARRRGINWHDLVKEKGDIDIWTPLPESVYFEATTVTPRIAEALVNNMMGADLDLVGGEVKPADLKKELIRGGPRRLMVLPKELVQQLDSMMKPKEEGAVAAAIAGAQSSWKAYTIYGRHAISYFIGNLTGDLDPVLGGALYLQYREWLPAASSV